MIWDSNILEQLQEKLRTKIGELKSIQSRNNNNSEIDFESKDLNKILLDITKATFSLAPLESSESISLIDNLEFVLSLHGKYTKYSLKYSLQILGTISKGAKPPILLRIYGILKHILLNSNGSLVNY